MQHDWGVRSVEQTDWVHGVRTSLSGGFNWDLNSETLQVDNSEEHEYSGQDLEHVRQVLSVESLQEGSLLVLSGAQQVEQGDNCTVEFSALTGSRGGRSKSLPHNLLTNVGGSEQGNTGTETIALLQQFVQQDDNDTGKHQLQNQQQAHTSTQGAWWTVHTGQHIHGGLANSQKHGKELLRGLELLSVLLVGHVYVYQFGTLQQLEHHGCRNNGSDTKLHQSTSVGSQHHSEPDQWVGTIGGNNTVKWNLRHHKEDQQSDTGPHDFLVERHLTLRRNDLRDQGLERLD